MPSVVMKRSQTPLSTILQGTTEGTNEDKNNLNPHTHTEKHLAYTQHWAHAYFLHSHCIYFS